MPLIKIEETDLTSPGSLNEESNVVYVPGIAKYLPKDFEAKKPRLYTSLSEFQDDFGTKVPRVGLGALQGNVPGFDEYFTYDTGFIYATELLRAGMPVLFDCLMERSDTVSNDGNHYNPSYANGDPFMYENIISKLQDHLNLTDDHPLLDKGLYNIKFVSNGGYVHGKDITATTNNLICNLAAKRLDCCAILDLPYNITDIDDVLKFNDFTLLGDDGRYCTAFYPWGLYNPTCILNYHKQADDGTYATDGNGKYTYYPDEYELPASFGYLMAAAKCFTSGVNNWAAIAGAARGTVPFLISLREDLTDSKVDRLQTRSSLSINPITTINPFGKIIWGNRTLFNNAVKGNLTASSFLNIRNLVSDVKKTVFTAARQMTFEQNSAILWVKFKSLITPTLDKMVSGSGLSGYELIKKVTKEKAKLVATVRLYAIEAVEDFDITIELADDTASVTE